MNEIGAAPRRDWVGALKPYLVGDALAGIQPFLHGCISAFPVHDTSLYDCREVLSSIPIIPEFP